MRDYPSYTVMVGKELKDVKEDLRQYMSIHVSGVSA